MSARNSAYSPVPQSNSDSDGSSEELHANEKSSIINRISKSQNVSFDKGFSGQNQNVVNYKLLGADGEVEATFIKFKPTSNAISVLKQNNKKDTFSASRKICFILSILICIFTTVIFIWFLPCNRKPCFFASPKSKKIIWEHVLEDVELFGPITLLLDASSHQNLVFLTRNTFNYIKNKNEKIGLLSLKGENGAEKWNVTLKQEPWDLDCNMIDLTLDGINDCLIMGASFLKAIDSVSGIEIWDFYSPKKKEILPHVIDFPVVIYDVNGDGINDLVTSCSFKQLNKIKYPDIKKQNYLIILCGKTGEIINTPKELKMCFSIHNVTIENSAIISFTCYGSDGKVSLEALDLNILIKTLNNYSDEKLVLARGNYNYKHPKESNLASMNGYKIIVDNQGQCPENCKATVDIISEKNENNDGNNKAIFTFSGKDTYCTFPTVLKRVNSSVVFIKFWKWESKKNISEGSTNRTSVKRAIKSHNHRDNILKNINSLYREMLKENKTEFKRYKRGANIDFEKTTHSMKLNDSDVSQNIYLYVVSEMIVSITLSGSHPFVRNITQNRILQICVFQTCRPDFESQKRSLSVIDVNGDDLEELISFSSGYLFEDSKGDFYQQLYNWKIQSVVRVATL